jgi:hypothetical protein
MHISLITIMLLKAAILLRLFVIILMQHRFYRIYMFFLFFLKYCLAFALSTLLITLSYGMELPCDSGHSEKDDSSILQESRILVAERMDAAEPFSFIDFKSVFHALPQERAALIVTQQKVINERDSLVAEMVAWNAQQKASEYFNSQNDDEKKDIFSKLSKLILLRPIEKPIVHAVLVNHLLLHDRCNRSLFESLRFCKEDAYLPEDRRQNKPLVNLPTIYKEFMSDAHISPVQLVTYSLEYGLWSECCAYLYDHSNGRVRLSKKSFYTDEMKQLLLDNHKMTLLGCMHLLHSAYDDVIRLCIHTKTIVKLLETNPIITKKFLYKRFLKIIEQANYLGKKRKICMLLSNLSTGHGSYVDANKLLTKIVAQTTLLHNNSDPLIDTAFGIWYAKAILLNPRKDTLDNIISSPIANMLKNSLECTNLYKREKTAWQSLRPYVVFLSDEYNDMFDTDFFWEDISETALNAVTPYLRPFVILQVILVNWHSFDNVDDNITTITSLIRNGINSAVNAYNKNVHYTFVEDPRVSTETLVEDLPVSSPEKLISDIRAQINGVCDDLNCFIGILQKHLMNDNDKHLHPLLFSALAELHAVAVGDKKDFIGITELLEMAVKFSTHYTIQEASMSAAEHFESISRYQDALDAYKIAIKGTTDQAPEKERWGIKIDNEDTSAAAWLRAICLAAQIKDKEQLAQITFMEDLSNVEPAVFEKACFAYNLVQLNGISTIGSEELQQAALYKYVYKMLEWHHTSCIKNIAEIISATALETMNKLIGNIVKHKKSLSMYDIDCIALHTWLIIKIIENKRIIESNSSNYFAITKEQLESLKQEVNYVLKLSLFMQNYENLTTPLSQMVQALERLHRNVFYNTMTNPDFLKKEIDWVKSTLAKIRKNLSNDYLYLMPQIDNILSRISRITLIS